MEPVLIFNSFAATFLGVLLGAIFTYKFGLLLYRRQQKITNDLMRKEQVYEPVFEDLKYIKNYLQERLDPSREYYHSQEPSLRLYTWEQIKSERRILLVNNKQIEDNCNKIQEYINDYHLKIKKHQEFIEQKIKEFFYENYQCELSKAFDGSLVQLSIIDRRYPIQRALDDIFSPSKFPVENQWDNLQKEIDSEGLDNMQNKLLDYIQYPQLVDEHNRHVQKILKTIDSTQNLLIKEIRKIIKESEG